MAERRPGHIPGIPVGSLFASREELSRAGIHCARVAGISGSGREGAHSIVLSGGYEDDEDFGDLILYTGHGGRDPKSGQQISHQTLTRGNLALAHSRLHGLPVRVIRGARHRTPYSPERGYRYDGLYMVEDYWRERGRAGFFVWRYRLVTLADDQPAESLNVPHRKMTGSAQQREPRVTRIMGDPLQAQHLKMLYHSRCQMCGVRLEGSVGPCVDAVHIRPLGFPHNGPDTPDNLLCLCPNCHILFDYGGVAIADDFCLIGQAGQLRVDFRHQISRDYLRYRREHYYLDPDED